MNCLLGAFSKIPPNHTAEAGVPSVAAPWLWYSPGHSADSQVTVQIRAA